MVGQVMVGGGFSVADRALALGCWQEWGEAVVHGVSSTLVSPGQLSRPDRLGLLSAWWGQ